jgi:hypothetical protein
MCMSTQAAGSGQICLMRVTQGGKATKADRAPDSYRNRSLQFTKKKCASTYKVQYQWASDCPSEIIPPLPAQFLVLLRLHVTNTIFQLTSHKKKQSEVFKEIRPF